MQNRHDPATNGPTPATCSPRAGEPASRSSRSSPSPGSPARTPAEEQYDVGPRDRGRHDATPAQVRHRLERCRSGEHVLAIAGHRSYSGAPRAERRGRGAAAHRGRSRRARGARRRLIQPDPSSVPPPARSKLRSVLTGQAAHEAAVARLTASYDAIPAGQTVRLAKKTSNLFRPRAATDAPGLDVSGPGRRDLDRHRGPDRRRAGHVHLRGPRRRDPGRGFIPYVVPQLRTITLGGAVSGLGIESTSFRSGLPHESVVEMDIFTGAGEVVTTAARATTCSTRSPTPTARSATPRACGSSWSGCRRTSPCATSASTTPGCCPRPSPRSCRPASTTGSGSTGSTARRSSRGSTT